MTLGRDRGFTLTEMLVVMTIVAALSAIAIMNLRKFEDPLLSGSAQVVSFMKQVRAAALSSTRAYTVKPSSSASLITQYAATCSATPQTADPRVTLKLPSGAALSDTSWTLCFNSRGYPDGNLDIQINDQTGQKKIVEVMLGGAVRIK